MDPFDQFDRQPWVDDALCAQVGPADDVWFPPTGGNTRPAKAVCGRCPALDSCREWIMRTETSDRHGVIGGLSAMERKDLAREQAAA